jgi:hypothetical protein
MNTSKRPIWGFNPKIHHPGRGFEERKMGIGHNEQGLRKEVLIHASQGS